MNTRSLSTLFTLTHVCFDSSRDDREKLAAFIGQLIEQLEFCRIDPLIAKHDGDSETTCSEFLVRLKSKPDFERVCILFKEGSPAEKKYAEICINNGLRVLFVSANGTLTEMTKNQSPEPSMEVHEPVAA